MECIFIYIYTHYIYNSDICKSIGKCVCQQQMICRAHGVVQGYLQRVGGDRASCQQASIAKQVCCLASLFTLLSPIRKPGDRKCGWCKRAFKAFLLHTSKPPAADPSAKRALPAPSSGRRLACSARGHSLLVWLSSLPGSYSLSPASRAESSSFWFTGTELRSYSFARQCLTGL